LIDALLGGSSLTENGAAKLAARSANLSWRRQAQHATRDQEPLDLR
jgi:hypothetical protein